MKFELTTEKNAAFLVRHSSLALYGLTEEFPLRLLKFCAQLDRCVSLDKRPLVRHMACFPPVASVTSRHACGRSVGLERNLRTCWHAANCATRPPPPLQRCGNPPPVSLFRSASHWGFRPTRRVARWWSSRRWVSGVFSAHIHRRPVNKFPSAPFRFALIPLTHDAQFCGAAEIGKFRRIRRPVSACKTRLFLWTQYPTLVSLLR